MIWGQRRRRLKRKTSESKVRRSSPTVKVTSEDTPGAQRFGRLADHREVPEVELPA
eukprot:CAMPEP_0118895294 /NCGR_PEP_ID=MMETSP1166-20130328/3708_1 /TAXON_ID=1104430 /ORGANISM="Chrysoreinhardia sp, Strain CCMP3193" /LENGTH=55 /DNA_ID=CAMNT_0006834301 /DNA_START=234 /DNA_END=397 /DNA_ORIENTATION=-